LEAEVQPIKTPIPDRAETLETIQNLRTLAKERPGFRLTGAVARRFMRGLIYQGAIASGQTPAEALKVATAPALDTARLVFNARFEAPRG
jgi:hypothetical protein